MTIKTSNLARITVAAMAALCLGLAWRPAIATPAPTLISGKIDSQVIHIGSVPVAPKVTLDLRGETERVYLYFNGPNNQSLDDFFYASEPNGRSTFDGAGVSNSFSLYAQSGTWTLTTVYVCSDRGCNEYTGSTLTPLFPSLTFTVVNPHSDTTPPTLNSAVVLTPTVTDSAKTKIQVDVNIQDDISGVASTQIMFTGSDDTIFVGGSLSYLVKSATTYELTDYCRCTNVPAGTYTATKITLTDAAGNQTVITDASQISTLFGGQPSFAIGN